MRDHRPRRAGRRAESAPGALGAPWANIHTPTAAAAFRGGQTKGSEA